MNQRHARPQRATRKRAAANNSFATQPTAEPRASASPLLHEARDVPAGAGMQHSITRQALALQETHGNGYVQRTMEPAESFGSSDPSAHQVQRRGPEPESETSYPGLENLMDKHDRETAVGAETPEDKAAEAEGGYADLTNLEQDMGRTVDEWYQAATDGVFSFVDDELAYQLDELSPSGWHSFLTTLLGNTIWAAAAFAPHARAAFAVSMIGIAIGSMPSIPKQKEESAIKQVRDSSLDYLEGIKDQIDKGLRTKAARLLIENPGISRYRALSQFVQASFKRGTFEVDPEFKARPNLDLSAIRNLFNRVATDQLRIAEAKDTRGKIQIDMATYVGIDPDTHEFLGDPDKEVPVFHGWHVESERGDEVGQALVRELGDGNGFPWVSAPLRKEFRNLWIDDSVIWDANAPFDTVEFNEKNEQVAETGLMPGYYAFMPMLPADRLGRKLEDLRDELAVEEAPGEEGVADEEWAAE
jgi:hypothetical protein